MENISLEKIAKISSGLALKRLNKSKRKLNLTDVDESLENDKEYHQITIKSVEDNKIDLNLFELVKTYEKIDDKYLIKKGDVVMKLTTPYSAAMIDFEYNNLVASHNLAVIKTNDKYDPEYLAYTLNNKNSKKQLRRLVEGTTMPTIKINSLRKIQIQHRDKIEQRNYVKLFRLLSKRLELKSRVFEIEKQLTEDVISNLS